MNRYQFKPKLSMTLAMMVVVSVCIWAGLWQYNKGQARIKAQQQIDQGLALAPVHLPAVVENKDDWQFKRVGFKGTYETEYQMLLDNRVHNGVPGYQVVTPVKVSGDSTYVLVNRGWIKGNARRTLPEIETPDGEQAFVGELFVPLDNVFTLESDVQNAQWEPLWQHINMQRYQAMVPFEVKPYMVRLAKESDAGGFVREWPVPKDRVKVHMGYAYQWFGFASTFFIIYIVLNLKKSKRESQDNE